MSGRESLFDAVRESLRGWVGGDHEEHVMTLVEDPSFIEYVRSALAHIEALEGQIKRAREVLRDFHHVRWDEPLEDVAQVAVDALHHAQARCGEDITRRFALSEAVEALTAAGYVVLTRDQGEEASVLLGVLAFGAAEPNAMVRAEELLASWPEAGRV